MPPFTAWKQGVVFFQTQRSDIRIRPAFYQPGHFQKDFSKRIARLFRERQIGDYGFDVSISADAAKEDLRHATIIVRAIADHFKTTQRGAWTDYRVRNPPADLPDERREFNI